MLTRKLLTRKLLTPFASVLLMNFLDNQVNRWCYYCYRWEIGFMNNGFLSVIL